MKSSKRIKIDYVEGAKRVKAWISSSEGVKTLSLNVSAAKEFTKKLKKEQELHNEKMNEVVTL